MLGRILTGAAGTAVAFGLAAPACAFADTTVHAPVTVPVTVDAHDAAHDLAHHVVGAHAVDDVVHGVVLSDVL